MNIFEKAVYDLRNNNEQFAIAEKFVLKEIEKANYPTQHPFLDYPSNAESMSLISTINLKNIGVTDDIIISMVKKCKGIENGKFNYDRYRQGINEMLFLYYLLIHTSYRYGKVPKYFYERNDIIENESNVEYSLLFGVNEEKILMNIEIKTLSCDVLSGVRYIDGQQLIVPYYKDDDFISRLEETYPNALILKDKCCLYQLERNIKKIAKKFEGRNLTEYKLFNVGVIFIDRAASIEQFYSYLFNTEFGLCPKTDFGNIDLLVLFTVDGKNDMLFSNLYNSGYVQSYLVNDCVEYRMLCEHLRLDNYFAVGSKIKSFALEESRKDHDNFKIMCREGFLNVIPYDSTEEEIRGYLDFLKGDKTRNSDKV